MVLPPEVLRVKRKRGDEPVETLYIPNDHQGNKRLAGENGFFFRRIQENEGASSVTRIPQVIATVSGEETHFSRQQRLTVERLKNGAVQLAHPKHGDAVVDKAKNMANSPRRFYLSKTNGTTRSLQSYTGRSRRRRNQSNDPMVLIEESPPPPPPPLMQTVGNAAPDVSEDAIRNSSKEQPEALPDLQILSASRGTDPTTNPQSLRQIQHSNLQEQESMFNPSIDVSPHHCVDQSKVEEGPLNPTSLNSEAVATTQGSETQDEMDFVYDTFVRTRNLDSVSIIHGHSSTKEPFGLIIIEEDRTEFWQDFGSDEESEKDWNSDQDDENAENYYGADYPEDEVDSDDEYDHNAYHYRKPGRGASDEEEFGSGSDVWSDDEDVNKYPWKKRPPACLGQAGIVGHDSEDKDDAMMV